MNLSRPALWSPQLPARILLATAALMPLALLAGCPSADDGNGDESNGPPVFNNTTDSTNRGASYIGSAACGACHPDVAGETRRHAHSFALNRVEGRAPEYPPEAARAGVPDPPAGSTWSDVSYVIAGYLHGAFFVDRDGFVLTDGVAATNTQWLLDFPANGTAAGFVAHLPDQVTPLPYAFECFRCHTTGPQPQDPGDPRSQDGRPGILGTWAEAGVRCEACHGPGSNHVPNRRARDIFVDSTPHTCGRCHTEGDDPDVIVVESDFLQANTQYPQLLASGGHSEFNCTVCHNPHASVTYDRERGLRNSCTTCHTNMNLAFHDDAVFRLGGYVEEVRCESCHMPLAGKSAACGMPTPPSMPSLSNRVPDGGGVGMAPRDVARIGDVRAHIFRISTEDADASMFFTDDGTAVRKDAEGRAALTVDFVCLRCHHGAGNVFPLTVAGAATIAERMHAKAD